MSASAGTTGVFGKMPAHGDFVRRALPGRFVDPWDAWLSAGMLRGAESFGESWPEAWEGAAAFRFRLSPGACGPEAVAGVLLPSGDTVGRRFPLTVAATLPEGGFPSPAWYDAAEEAGTRAAAGALDADALAGAVPPPDGAPEDPDSTLDGSSRFWRGEEVLLVALGLPAPERFPALLGLGAPAAPEPAATAAYLGAPGFGAPGFDDPDLDDPDLGRPDVGTTDPGVPASGVASLGAAGLGDPNPGPPTFTTPDAGHPDAAHSAPPRAEPVTDRAVAPGDP